MKNQDKRAGVSSIVWLHKEVTSHTLFLLLDVRFGFLYRSTILEGAQYVFLTRLIGLQHSVQLGTALRKNLVRPQHLSKGMQWHPSIYWQREDDPSNPLRNADNSSICAAPFSWE